MPTHRENADDVDGADQCGSNPCESARSASSAFSRKLAATKSVSTREGIYAWIVCFGRRAGYSAVPRGCSLLLLLGAERGHLAAGPEGLHHLGSRQKAGVV